MSKLTQKLINIFANISPTGPSGEYQLVKFGSFKAGSPVASSDPDIIQALSAYLYGFNEAILNGAPPAIQDVDSLNHLITRQLAYIHNTGISEFNSETEYYTSSLLSDPDSFGTILKSETNNNISNSKSDNTYFVPIKTNKWTIITTNPLDAYTAGYDEFNFIVDLSGGKLIYIPGSSSKNKGRKIYIKNIQSNATVIIPLSGTIHGTTSFGFGPNQHAIFLSTGSDWELIEYKI